MIAIGFGPESPLADTLQVHAPTSHPAADTTSCEAEWLTEDEGSPHRRSCYHSTILSFSAFDLGELAEYIYEQDYISSKELVKIPCVY